MFLVFEGVLHKINLIADPVISLLRPCKWEVCRYLAVMSFLACTGDIVEVLGVTLCAYLWLNVELCDAASE